MSIVAILGSTLLTAAGTYCFVRAARARNILALPNDRSSHVTPVPTGGGWVVLGVTLVGWLFLMANLDAAGTALLSATVILAMVSWVDDLRTLPASLRLFVQALAVALCLAQIPFDTRVLSNGLPFWMDRVVVGLGWLWFINLYNFMDGIDGLAAVETITICLGFFLLSSMFGFSSDLSLLSAILAGSAAGFLVWNWQPAKIILGDVGAIPLGFIVGWLLIQLALKGHLAAAVILPLYYAADATITLAKRILQRQRFWLPHRQHFYQRPVVAGLSHSRVVLRIIPANAALMGVATLSIGAPVLGLVLGAIVVACLLIHLHFLAQKK